MQPGDEQFFHISKEPDWSRWPFSEPWIMTELKRKGLTVANAASLNSAEIYDMTGQPWMDRALMAENNLRIAVQASEWVVGALQKAENTIRKLERT